MTAQAWGKGFAGAFGKGMSDSPFARNNQFGDGISIEEAAEQAKMNFTIKECPSLYMVNGQLHATGEKTLFREDTGDFISSMSQGYKLVQPMEVLETHRSLLDTAGYHLRSAGIFKNGARFWSMAEAHGEVTLQGVDPVKSYLFMASAADGSSSTYAVGTHVRMACWNQARAIVNDAKDNAKFIRVTHSQTFDANEVKTQIMANDEIFKRWSEDARMLSEQKLKVDAALGYFANVFDIDSDEEDEIVRLSTANDNKRVQKCLELFCGAGAGSDLVTAKGTVWGAYNAVTEYVTHYAGARSPENRFANSMTGAGDRLKNTAWRYAMDLCK